MKKRLIAVMLTGVVLASTLTGCSGMIEEDTKRDMPSSLYKTGRIEDVYLAVEGKNERVLHKGDVAFYRSGVDRSSVGIDLTDMEFDCGKRLISNSTFSMSFEMPEDEDYDVICDKCFDLRQ